MAVQDLVLPPGKASVLATSLDTTGVETEGGRETETQRETDRQRQIDRQIILYYTMIKV